MTILIDAYENRHVATADISGAYLHAEMKEFVCIRFARWACDLLCDDLEYQKQIVYDGKRKLLMSNA